MAELINIDADLDNADWTKGTWDLLDITNVEQLRAWLDRTGSTPEAFKQLPIYKRNVTKPEMAWLRDL